VDRNKELGKFEGKEQEMKQAGKQGIFEDGKTRKLRQ